MNSITPFVNSHQDPVNMAPPEAAAWLWFKRLFCDPVYDLKRAQFLSGEIGLSWDPGSRSLRCNCVDAGAKRRCL